MDGTQLLALLTTGSVGGAGTAFGVWMGVQGGRVFGRLLLGVTDIPAALLERPARLVRAKTDELIEDRKFLAAAARASGTLDVERTERALLRHIAVEDRKQTNRESVASEAFENLSADPPKTAEAISEEFIGAFEDLADTADTDDLRSLFARILAGECRKPGTYSRQTLSLMRSMDRKLASVIESVAGLVQGPEGTQSIFNSGLISKGRGLLDFRYLESIGLLTTGTNLPGRSDYPMLFYDCIIHGLNASRPVNLAMNFLTPMGEQVFGLVRCPISKAQSDDVVGTLRNASFQLITRVPIDPVTKIAIGPAIHL